MSSNLEKRVGKELSQEEIQKIVDSYLKDNNALRVSRELDYSYRTILKCLKDQGLKIKTGRKKGTIDQPHYNLIKDLISAGHYQGEIAKILAVSHQAVEQYIGYHHLEKPINRIKTKADKKYNLVKRLINDGDSFEDIAEFLTNTNYSFYQYLRLYHPDLKRPKRRTELERERKIELIKNGLLKGLSQNTIAKSEGIPQMTVCKYVNKCPQLRELYNKNYRMNYPNYRKIPSN